MVLDKEAERKESKDRDSFFTKRETALRCWYYAVAHCVLQGLDPRGIRWVEPSAGSGAFMRAAPLGIEPQGMDLHPMRHGIKKQDFLEWEAPQDMPMWAVIGNPPFGRTGAMAARFITHALEQGAEFAAFILPGCLKNYTAQRNVPQCYGPETTIPLGRKGLFELPGGRSYAAGHCVFQIWVRGGPRAMRHPNKHPDFKYWIYGNYRLAEATRQREWDRWVLNGRWDLCIAASNYKRRFLAREDLPATPEGMGSLLFFRAKPKVLERLRALDYEKLRHEAQLDGNEIASLSPWQIVRDYEALYGRPAEPRQLGLEGICRDGEDA